MKRILFTHSYFLRFDPKQWQIMQPYAPLGTILAAAVVRNEGYQVKLWDPMFAKKAAEISPIMEEFDPDVLVIYDDGFNYLTKMCLTNMREAAFKMIRYASAKNIPVIVCSSDATDHYDKYLDQGAFAVIKGEGEQSLLQLLNRLKSNNNHITDIEGLIFRTAGKTIVNKPKDVLKQLDELPLPAWDLVDMSAYRKAWINRHGYFSINMSTTRGCPFKCNWCAKPIYGNRYNSRSPENAVNEIEYLINNYRPNHIWFCDDIFGLKPGWVNHFADILHDKKISINYKIQSRVDLLLQENNIAALARSGCETVWVGAESGSQAVLDAMDKGTRVEQIYEATNLLRKYGIKPAFFLQFGYPGETRGDIEKTIRMVKELLPHDIGISVSYPLPGTPFYERVKSELASKANWADSDDLTLMFNNTYPAPFYKHLHRYVHKTYRIHQGKQFARQLLKGKINPGTVAFKRIAGVLYHRPGAWVHLREMQKYSSGAGKLNGINGNSGNVKVAFDHVANEYDGKFTTSITGVLQRKSVRRFIERKIDPVIYKNVLELNCGTGEDAIWMASKGFRVTATDISNEMIRVAVSKGNALQFSHAPEFKTLNFNELATLENHEFDLIFSNFGGLNCAAPDQLKSLAMEANKLLRPGGKFIAVVMGRKCLVENVYWSIKNPGLKKRRQSVEPVKASLGSTTFPVWYYSPDEFSTLMHPWLSDAVLKPVGFFIPPSWMNNYFSKSKTIVNGAAALEKLTANAPFLSDYADHYLIELTRR